MPSWYIFAGTLGPALLYAVLFWMVGAHRMAAYFIVVGLVFYVTILLVPHGST